MWRWREKQDRNAGQAPEGQHGTVSSPRESQSSRQECEKQTVGCAYAILGPFRLPSLPLPPEAGLHGVCGWVALLSDCRVGSASGRLQQEIAGLEERCWCGDRGEALHSRSVTSWERSLPTALQFPRVWQASHGVGGL